MILRDGQILEDEECSNCGEVVRAVVLVEGYEVFFICPVEDCGAWNNITEYEESFA